MSDNLIENLEKTNASINYLRTLEDYGGFEKLGADLVYIFKTLPELLELGEDILSRKPTVDSFGTNIDYMYYTLKALANTANFASVMVPICRRYFPTDEDKAKFAKFIRRLEEVKNNDSESEIRDE